MQAPPTDAEFELTKCKDRLTDELHDQAVAARRHARRVATATIAVAVAAVKAGR